MFNKKRNLGMYVIIDYCQEAKNWVVGGAKVKKIYTMFNKKLIKIESYNIIKHKELIKRGLYIHDRTAGTEKPIDAIKTPLLHQVLSNIEISRRLV